MTREKKVIDRKDDDVINKSNNWPIKGHCLS